MSPSDTPASILSLKPSKRVLASWPFSQGIHLFVPCWVSISFSSGSRRSCVVRCGRTISRTTVYHLIPEVKHVIKESLALQNDPPALEKYMHDRQVMTAAILEVGYDFVIRRTFTAPFPKHAAAVQTWLDTRHMQMEQDKLEVINERRAE